ncbi:Lrp/AsnC family transcriptional regulator [Caenispirillum bisanense]|uniref:Transcriptional regulator, AsnC family n=1 Tax=Caenispirillum bisanense TaxID=414052 RepID=A0A286GXH5_9PROT|nr:Lrp/AsnC ligand binding domain-containing protein [Caenispirillum bisanense]SOD99876.1 transcriptional regulator, AsnC family [Caenispirillum bisanense]
MRAVFVMIKCELGKAYQVADQAVEDIEQISEIYSTSGQYDLLAKFYVDDDVDVGRFVTEKVQTLTGVKDTFTLITFNAFTPDKSPGGTRIA